jgi:hypothetical protein
MSDLNPIGEVIVLDGVERHLLFTLNVIDELQDKQNATLDEVVSKLTDKKESNKALKCILSTLLNDEAERTGGKLKTYTEKEVGWLVTIQNVMEVTVAVLRAYGYSLPEADEFDSHPNAEGRSE